MTAMTTLTSDDGQVTLRPVTLADVTPAYVAWLNDPEVNRYLETRFSPVMTRFRSRANLSSMTSAATGSPGTMR